MRIIAATAAVDVGVGGGPAGNADAHGGAVLPDGDAAPTGAVFLKFFVRYRSCSADAVALQPERLPYN